MRRHFSLVFASCLILFPLAATASTLLVSESGVFATGTPTTATSVSGGAFSFSFQLASSPAVSGVSDGNYFSPVFSNFTYSLNGIPTSPSVGGITFFSSAHLGLLNICFMSPCSGTSSPSNGFQIEGFQAYSGTEAAPNILTGSYVPASDAFYTGGTPYILSSETPVVISATNVTPEPSTFVLLGTGLIGAAGAVRLRLRA